MIIIDTNILIRYFTADDQKVHSKLVEFFKLVTSNKQEIFVSDIVITETIFVLQSSIYNIDKKSATIMLAALIKLNSVKTESNKNVLLFGLEIYKKEKIHLIDCMIIAKGILDELEIFTFDKKMLKVIDRLDGKICNF